jgi:hypothetical protein
MKKILMCLMLAGLLTGWAVAQDNATDAKGKDSVRTITGCLAKGDSSDEFQLNAADGSTWEMKANNSVDLAAHVGHQVRVTGAVDNSTMHNLKEDSKDVAKDTGMKKNNAEHGHLKATDVQMVSDSCTK